MCYIELGDIMQQINEQNNTASVNTKGNGDGMPTVESVNYEMTEYLQDLMDIGIIDENGRLTEFYQN